MKLFPPAPEPLAFGQGEGLLFWYGAPHVAQAKNSRRYRIENRLEQLPQARSFAGRRLPPDELQGVQRVLCVRPFVDRLAERELARLRARGIELWADYDDLLFTGPLEQFPGAGRFWQRRRLARRLPVYREGLARFDAFTCTTPPIAEALRELCPTAEVHLVPNVPSPRWIQEGWARYGAEAWQAGAPRVLRYLPGSPSHDEDFAVVEDTLAELLHAHPELSLEIVGYLNFQPSKFPRERLRHLPLVPPDELPRFLLSSWLNLVPLAASPYSQARSNIKVLEAEAFDVPSVTGSPSEFRSRIEAARSAGR